MEVVLICVLGGIGLFVVVVCYKICMYYIENEGRRCQDNGCNEINSKDNLDVAGLGKYVGYLYDKKVISILNITCNHPNNNLKRESYQFLYQSNTHILVRS